MRKKNQLFQHLHKYLLIAILKCNANFKKYNIWYFLSQNKVYWLEAYQIKGLFRTLKFFCLGGRSKKGILLHKTMLISKYLQLNTIISGDRLGRDCMVVGFTITYTISAYHHLCEFESRSGRGVQHYVIKIVTDLRQVGGFLRVFRFKFLTNKTDRHDDWNIVESGVNQTNKQHIFGNITTMLCHDFVLILNNKLLVKKLPKIKKVN